MKKISTAAHRILNDSRKLQERDRWFHILEDLFDGREEENAFLREYVPSVNGWVGSSGFDLDPRKHPTAYTDPEQWVVNCLEEMAEYAAAADQKPWFEPLCIEHGVFGTHFIDRIFGSEVFYLQASDPTDPGQWSSYPCDMPVGQLKRPDLEHSETWQLAKAAARSFAAQDVSLPLFGLPTIASALNIGVNLFGGNLLEAMIEEPEAARHDLGVINGVLMEIHQLYRDMLPSAQIKPVSSTMRTMPDGYGQLCGCSTHMLSGRLYRELVAPLDADLLNVFPRGGMIHLCGNHLQHIPTFAALPQLRAVQVNGIPLDHIQQYHSSLRQDQVLYVYPYEKAPTDQVVAATGGHRLVFMGPIEPVRKASQER